MDFESGADEELPSIDERISKNNSRKSFALLLLQILAAALTSFITGSAIVYALDYFFLEGGVERLSATLKPTRNNFVAHTYSVPHNYSFTDIYLLFEEQNVPLTRFYELADCSSCSLGRGCLKFEFSDIPDEHYLSRLFLFLSEDSKIKSFTDIGFHVTFLEKTSPEKSSYSCPRCPVIYSEKFNYAIDEWKIYFCT